MSRLCMAKWMHVHIFVLPQLLSSYHHHPHQNHFLHKYACLFADHVSFDIFYTRLSHQFDRRRRHPLRFSNFCSLECSCILEEPARYRKRPQTMIFNFTVAPSLRRQETLTLSMTAFTSKRLEFFYGTVAKRTSTHVSHRHWQHIIIQYNNENGYVYFVANGSLLKLWAGKHFHGSIDGKREREKQLSFKKQSKHEHAKLQGVKEKEAGKKGEKK